MMNNDLPDRHAASFHASFPVASRGSSRRYVPLTPWLAGAFVLAVAAGLVVPAWNQVADDGSRAKALAQAKQVGLALKLFAGDNNGVYPADGMPAELHAPANSNAAFAVLLPTYTESERIFSNSLSAYQTRPPDNIIDNPYTGKSVKTLAPGENVYAYLTGLTDAFYPSSPLVVDGTDGTGHYVTDPAKRGGTWSGEEAVVIRLDNSGSLAKLAGPADARYVPLGVLAAATGGKADDNLLEVSRLGGGVRLLDPAIDTSTPQNLQ